MDIGITTLLTVTSGVLVFALCEILKEIWLEPLRSFKSLKGRIAYNLVLHANKLSNPIVFTIASKEEVEEYRVVSSELRKLAAESTGFAQTIVLRWGMPSKRKFDELQQCLIGLSNGIYTSQGNQYEAIEKSDARIDKIRKILRISSDL